MIRWTQAVSAALLASALSMPVFAQQAQPQPEVRATHGDWDITCIPGTESCAMSQIGSTAAGERALLVTIQRLTGATADNGTAVPAALSVQTPLGILIPYGIRLKIDSDEVVPLPVARCVPSGCVSQTPISDQAVAKMKRGTAAVFGFVLDQEVLVNVSLRGFTKAYDSLTPVAAQQRQ